MKTKIEKIIFYLSYFFRITIGIAIIVAFFEKNYLTGFLAFLVLIITFLPSLIERNYKITFPIEFEILLVFFLYGSLFLGEFHSYYLKYWWWDIFLHTLSGVILALIGFMIIYVLNYEEKVKLKLSPLYFAVFTFSFALALGALWEIFEFFMDNIFGMNMQKTGLDDTMHDLIVDSIGAFFISVLGYFYVRDSKSLMLGGLINKFIDKNPDLFKKKRKK